MRTYPLHIFRGPMAGRVIPATPGMIDQARQGGYGQGLADGRPPATDRSPHPAGEAFAAAYADRQLRAAMMVGPDPLEAMRQGAETAKPAAEPDKTQAGSEPEGGKRKPGRPARAKG